MPGIRQGVRHSAASTAAVPASTAASAALAASSAAAVAQVPMLCQIQLHISNFKGWRDAQHGSRSYERSLCCCAPRNNERGWSELKNLSDLHGGTPRFIFKDKVDLSDTRRWQRCSRGARMFIVKSSQNHPGSAAVLNRYLMQKRRVARFTFTSNEEIRLYLAPASLLLWGEHYRASFLNVLPRELEPMGDGEVSKGALGELLVGWVEHRHRHKRPPSAAASEASTAPPAGPSLAISAVPRAATPTVPPTVTPAAPPSVETTVPPALTPESAPVAASAPHGSSTNATSSVPESLNDARADNIGRAGGTPDEPGGAAADGEACSAAAAAAAAQLQQPITSPHSLALKASQDMFRVMMRQQQDAKTDTDRANDDASSMRASDYAPGCAPAAASASVPDAAMTTDTDTDTATGPVPNPSAVSAAMSASAASTSDSPALVNAQAVLRDLLRQHIDCGRAEDHRKLQEQLLVLSSLEAPSNETLQRLGVGRDLTQAKKLLKEQGHAQLYMHAKEVLNTWKKSIEGVKGEQLQRQRWGPGHPIEKGATVTVVRRAGVGIKTRPGGAGRVTAVNHDSCTYNVKFTIIGTHEKQVAQQFVSASNVLVTQTRKATQLPVASLGKRAGEEVPVPSQHAQKKHKASKGARVADKVGTSERIEEKKSKKKDKSEKKKEKKEKKETSDTATNSSSGLGKAAKTNKVGGKATPFSKQQRGTLPTLVDMLSLGVVKAGDTLRAMPRIAGQQYRLDGKLRADGRIIMDPDESYPTGKIFESPSGFCMFAIAYGRGQGKCNGWKSCFHVSADGDEKALDTLRKMAR